MALYAYSFDEDTFYQSDEYATRETAIAAALEVNPTAEAIWTGVVIQPDTASLAPDPGWLLDYVAETAVNTFEYMDSPFLTDVKEPALKDLGLRISGVLHQWMKDHDLEPSFFNVEDVVFHKVKQTQPEDIN